MRRKLAAGNWKMNGLGADLGALDTLPVVPGIDVLICPPATLIDRLVQRGTVPLIGGQDCHAAASGAHTGDISAAMLADAGATHVIVGHSERRTDHSETNDQVNAKVTAAWAAGLVAILCIGETEAQYRAGQTLDVLRDQLAGSLPDGATAATLVVAYEPVWAIGTGLVPGMDEIATAHRVIRETLTARLGKDIAAGVRLLYGGSVKSSNAAEIFAVADVDGALVGGASLKAADFGPIVAALADRAAG